MSRTTTILLCLLAFVVEGRASTIVTPAQGAMMALSKALQHYADAREGRLPENLNELDPYLVSSLERQLGGIPLDQSIMFLNKRGVEMVTPNKNEVFTGGQILAVTASPIEGKGVGKGVRRIFLRTGARQLGRAA